MAGPLIAPADPAPTRRLTGLWRRLPGMYVEAWRSVRPTREGLIFLATAAAVALAALNTGNNLLYLVFAAMLAIITLSGVLSEASLRDARVQRRLDSRVFAGEPVTGAWTVRNRRKLLPHLALRIEERPGRWAELSSPGRAGFPYVPAGTSQDGAGRWVFSRRGVHRLDRVRISTTWPFGIFRKWFETSQPMDVVVFPALDLDAGGTTRSGPAGLVGRAPKRGGTGDLHGLREHRPGDDRRRIHWRATARFDRLIAAEREEHEGGRLDVRLGLPGEGEAESRAARFEQLVSAAAGSLWRAIDQGLEVRLLLPDGRIDLAHDAEGRDRLLEHLARVELTPVAAKP